MEFFYYHLYCVEFSLVFILIQHFLNKDLSVSFPINRAMYTSLLLIYKTKCTQNVIGKIYHWVISHTIHDIFWTSEFGFRTYWNQFLMSRGCYALYGLSQGKMRVKDMVLKGNSFFKFKTKSERINSINPKL